MEKILGKKIDRRDFVKIAGIGVLGAATAGFPNVLRSAEKWRLKFASHEPERSLYNQSSWLWFCDRVERTSDGAVKFDRFPGETLVKQGSLYEACRDGLIHAGIFIIPSVAGLMPLATITDLPFSFGDIETMRSAWPRFIDAGLNEYFHSYGIHIIYLTVMTPFVLFSSRKWGPIRRLEDLKGCKVRAPGGYVSQALKAMGAIPVTTLGSEVYTSMERGTIDCVSMSEPSGISWKIQEVTKFITRVNFVTGAYPFMFNLKTWESLPQDIRNIMFQAGREAEVNVDKESLRYQRDVIDQAIMKAGVEIVPLDKAERERMKKACAPVWDEWIAKNGPVFNGLGKKMFDIVGQTVGKP